ncbi:MAG: DUF2460 domain-containing protein [Pseudomonadota bacterium]
MTFHDVRFPTSLSLGAVGGPQRRTEVVTLANGYEERNTPWAHARRVYDAGIGMRSIDDLHEVIAFFEARMGQLHAFRWKDWADYKSADAARQVSFDDQSIAIGDGVQTQYQLVKNYVSGDQVYKRPIRKPVAGTVRVGVEQDELQFESEYTVDNATGIVTFATPPELDAEVFAGFEFDVPVRFDTDRILASIESFQAGQVPDVPVIEVRV